MVETSYFDGESILKKAYRYGNGSGQGWLGFKSYELIVEIAKPFTVNSRNFSLVKNGVIDPEVIEVALKEIIRVGIVSTDPKLMV